ncbi:MAG: acyl-ACP--UDP-N-acetylglucosamine O-acyltransferase [Notoacmeibacter sp.]|nr:acyl-ACP--UDP-N-acetylglucosamine O-acyltransferase [Notoacmeibacter sp.]
MTEKPFIHPSAVIEEGAVIGEGVRIGPFCHVGPEAVLRDGVELMSHVTVDGATTIGEGTRVFPHAVLGCEPQNHKHKGGRTTLEIGRNNIIREGVTMHRGTDTARGRTTVGDNCHMLAYSHVAHDCVVGNNVTLTYGAVLGGHCEIGDHANVGGLTAIHQFVRIGHHAFLGGCSAVTGDVIPFGIAVGNRARLHGFNIVGMRRSGMPRQEIQTMRQAYRMIFDPARPVSENLDLVREAFPDQKNVADIADFLQTRGKRQFCVPALEDRGQDDDGAEDE